MNLFEELKWRGLIKDISSPELEKKLNEEKISFYWGTDPTADSLHLGHYSSLVTAKRLARAGHHPILLVGGATGLIGDPRPTSEREIIKKETLNHNLEGIKRQVEGIFNGNVEIVNNYDWFCGYEFLDFLRDVGKYINVNYMLNKDIIRRRLESGITYAEFSYTLIQGYDFLRLYQNKNCVLQAAGSDQWGNITTGIDLIRKITGNEAYGFTMPLVTDKSGKKFGKSEGNAIWLDLNKTSSYEMYQYLVNVEDEMVIDYLKIFTFLTRNEIEKLEISNKEHPELREAHKTLAREIITDLHGKEEYEKALHLSEVLFTEEFKSLTASEIEEIFKGNKINKVTSDNLVDLLIEVNAAKSKREAREFILGNAIKVNGQKIEIKHPAKTHEEAVDFTLKQLINPEYKVIDSLDEISAIGHRLVHGGEKINKSVIITDEVVEVLKECIDLAPLHNPAGIIGIEACKKVMPGKPMVGVFDTAFHQTMPKERYIYPIPYEYYKKYGIRKYGFHGTSHMYVSQRLAEIVGKDISELKIVTCHLGQGSSICAVEGGKSVDTSMGLTPLAGIPMVTRSGDLDPSVVTFLMKKEGWTAEEAENMLNKKSGVQGISGLAPDFREIEAASYGDNERAEIAIEKFKYEIASYIAKYAVAMNGVDYIVFTGGVGENQINIRRGICEKLEFMGVKIDVEANNVRGEEKEISAPDSKVKVYLVPTNEELMIAKETARLIK